MEFFILGQATVLAPASQRATEGDVQGPPQSATTVTESSTVRILTSSRRGRHNLLENASTPARDGPTNSARYKLYMNT